MIELFRFDLPILPDFPILVAITLSLPTNALPSVLVLPICDPFSCLDACPTVTIILFSLPLDSVDKMVQMVGSYPPKKEIQSYTTPFEEAPSGMMARGTYSVTSLFTDDDKNEHLKWDWSFEIKKDWQ